MRNFFSVNPGGSGSGDDVSGNVRQEGDMRMGEIINTAGLTKYYGKNRGIINMDLSIQEGEVFGVIGPNGAGKSTLIRILLGLVKPTSGTASVFGLEVGRQQREILTGIGYLPSEAMFYRGMKVSEILEFSARLYKKDCKAEQKRLCERFALDVHRRVEELSLGNRKKTAIVSAFQHLPGLLVLDEPTSGLDPLMQKEFFDLVEERHKKGATVMLSSHVLTEVRQHCGRAGILREGQMIACDRVERLVGKKYRKVELKGVSEVPKLDGIRETTKTKEQVSFLYEGSVKALLEMLAQMPLEDVVITEPELEEIFLHYYEKGGAEQ